ncbi:sugar transferase [Gammaproteobacteria bacterium]|nr:sugar transferase [Gammaproteobacteria bacterium]
MKRILDFIASFFGLIVISPVLFVVMFLVWIQDKKSPFYVSFRVGKDEKLFKIVKLRSMVVDADKTGVDSTSLNDSRITPIGHFIRKYKLDELSQLINVLQGNMSLVGPRPNVLNETALYSDEEKKLLSVKPGITDFASIVFSDESEILKDSKDPDLDYNQLIRPGKNYLGLFYIEKSNFFLDITLCLTTIISIFSKKKSLAILNRILIRLNAPDAILKISSRKDSLKPMPPPGLDEIIISR